MNMYYFYDGKQELGPFTLTELLSHSITAETPVWHKGMKQWTVASLIPELQVKLAAEPAPPPFHERTTLADEPYISNMERYHPPQKSHTKYYLLAGLFLLAATTLWLLFQNKGNRDQLQSLQADVTNKEQVAEQQQRNEQARAAAIADKKRRYRQNWDRFITETHRTPAIDYTLGGISSFPVQISNTTEYTLDQVDVQVEYIRKSGKIWQREVVSYFNVAPGSTEAKLAPESVNGVEVRVSIQKVISRDMEFCYPIGNGPIDDPYYCQ